MEDEELREEEAPPEEEEEEELLEVGDVASGWEWKPSALGVSSHEAKLRELLGNLCRTEVTIYSDAAKEFIELLKGELGGNFLLEYVRSSPKLLELMEAWRLHQGKSGISHVLKLVSVVVGHAFGRSRSSGISRNIDSFARSIISSKLDDLYTELKSGEGKRQASALFLLASVVRRGVVFASEVAKIFMFNLPALQKFSGSQAKKGGRDGKRRTSRSSRKAFVEFAMSFLEVGNPRLLRWILQQKDMYSAVLRGLGTDDHDTVIYVLSVLRDKLLCADSLVPPGLRSVLFGSITLEQLIFISGNPEGGDASDIAHQVLISVCTDPCNGLMPHGNLKGNFKRLSDLMMKLKATESIKHKELLLAIVRGRPLLCSSYMDEFPYHLEPRASPQWYSAISVAADMVSSVNSSTSFSFLDSFINGDPPSLETKEVQCTLRCIMPRSCSRAVINKGLLHSDILVKHGSIRLVLEALKLLDSFINSISCLLDRMHAKESTDTGSVMDICIFSETSVCASEKDDHGSYTQKWALFRGQIQDEVRSVLPDPQVLLKLLASFTSEISRTSGFSLKRCSSSLDVARKKSKHEAVKDVSEVDIVVGVTSTSKNIVDIDVADTKKQFTLALSEIWGPNSGVDLNKTENLNPLLYAKLLDCLKLFLRTLPLTIEGSFDFMKILTNDPSKLSITLQESTVSLLLEYAGQAHEGNMNMRVPPMMHKSLHLLLGLLILSSNQLIKRNVFTLAKTAMMSTGAFDHIVPEIEAWLLLLPGYSKDRLSDEFQRAPKIDSLFSVVISFFCDAVSTVANNLYRYLDQLRAFSFKLNDQEDICPDFSPLVICILQKCIRVLESDSKTFNLTEKSMISLYVHNALSFILQTQVNLKILSGVIVLMLKEKLNEPLLGSPHNCRKSLCEWRPLNELLLLATAFCEHQVYYPLPSPKENFTDGEAIPFYSILNKVTEFMKNGDKDSLFAAATAMCFSIVCTNPAEVLENLPILIAIVSHLPTAHIQFLSFVLFECGFLVDPSNLWDIMFLTNSGKVVSFSTENIQEKNAHKYGVSGEHKAVGVGMLLENATFYALFSGIVKTKGHSLFDSSKVRDLLCSKLEGIFMGDWSLPLQFVLFWAYQIRLRYEKKPSSLLEQMFKLSCFVLNSILDKAMDQPSPSGFLKLVHLIIQHPVVRLSILHPFYDSKFNEGDIKDYSIHQMDVQILQLLKRQGEFLQVSRNTSNHAFEGFAQLMENLMLSVKDKFNIFIEEKDVESLFPTSHIFHALMPFISSFRLMEMVDWMVCKIEANMGYFTSLKTRVLSLIFDITGISVEKICIHLNTLSERQVKLSASVLQNLYCKILEFSIRFKIDSADRCLLKLMECIHGQNLFKSTCSVSIHPSTMLLCRIFNSSPLKLIIHCVYETSKTKARILFHLVEASPLHRSFFGMIFLKFIECLESSSSDITRLPEFDISSNYSQEFSDDDLLVLLPVVLSYTNATVSQNLNTSAIISLYSKILLKGFENWQTFTSRKIFDEDFTDCVKLTSTEEFLHCFRNTLLGKAICMIHLHFVSNLARMKKRYLIDTFNSFYDGSSSDQLLDVRLNKVEDSFNVVNRAMAKISFAQLLLLAPKSFTPFSEVYCDEVSESQKGDTSKSKNLAKLRFLDMLVHSLHNLIGKFNWNKKNNNDGDATHVFRFLELYILRTIVLFSAEMKGFLLQLPNISFLKPMVRTLLLHRFDDPDSLRAIRVLVCTFEMRSVASEILELLLGHSEFINTILWNAYDIDSPSINLGTLLQPVQSIFKLFDEITETGIDDQSPSLDCKISCMFSRKLELIKLLRVLFFFKNSGEKVGLNPREFFSLLLSGYGATVRETDLQTLHLIHEIESTEEFENHNIAEMDYLWGKSAVMLRREKNIEEQLSMKEILDIETEEEKRRRLFRENLPLNPKRCLITALNFCFNREELMEPISLKSLLCENSMNLKVLFLTLDNFLGLYLSLSEAEKLLQMLPSSSQEADLPYDPGFLLPLSVHCLRRGYVEPVEFIRLGLLAVVVISTSSSDEHIRRLGYEALAVFKAILEGCRRSKDILQLQLLLAYLQNGISEENQKLPSLISMFSAEASFILLDPSHNSFQVITKFLMNSSRADLKDLPLFNSSIASHSIHFKSNFAWMLKLLCAGLNSDDDARIVIKKHLFEHLMSVYVSCLSDYETNTLILRIMKKSIKLGMLSSLLVKHHGLIPWVCSIVTQNPRRLLEDQKETFLNLLEVVNYIIQSRPVRKWLRENALEQLSDLSLELHSIFINFATLFKDLTSIMSYILSIIKSTLEISQERDPSRPQFSLSIEALFQLSRTLDSISTAGKLSSTALLGLRIILTSKPPPVKSQTEKSKLLKIATWALTACQKVPRTHQNEEHEVSKLLRWITASVIRGITSGKQLEDDTLESLLLKITTVDDEEHDGNNINKNLGSIVLHIWYLVGRDFPSGSSLVFTSLSFLLLSSFDEEGEMLSLCRRIRRPIETSPGWKWLFNRECKDLSEERTHLQVLEEEQSCQSLLLKFINILGEEPGSKIQLHQEIRDSGLFEWEKSLLL